MKVKEANKIKDRNDLLNRNLNRLYDKQKSTLEIKSELNAAEKLAAFNQTVNKIEKQKPSKNYMADVSKMMETMDQDALRMDILPRKKLYNTYRFILANFPQIANACRITVDHILNPEQLNNDVLVATKTKLASEVSDAEVKELDHISAYFKIEENARETITGTLRDGDYFTEILNIDDYNVRFGDSTKQGEMIKENSLEMLNSYDTIKTEGKKQLASVIETALFENFESMNTSTAIKMAENINELIDVNGYDFDTEILLESTNNNLRFEPQRIDNKELDKKDDNYYKNEYRSIMLKNHKPETVVNLEVNDVSFGFLVISIDPTSLINNKDNSSLFTQYSSATGAKKVAEKDFEEKFRDYIIPKITAALKPTTKNAAVIKKVIERDEKLKMILFNLIGDGKKANIRFVEPTNMVHFKNDGISDDNRYGESCLASQLFMIKHYFAVLMSHTAYSLTRAIEKEVVYVNVNVDGDAEASLTEVVKRMKQKEEVVKKDIATLDNLSTEMSLFDRYYIPKINGETPIEISSIPSGQSSLDPEHLENLRQNIVRGLRVPRNLISESDGTYKTSFTQENIAFAMTIIGYQHQFAMKYNELFSKIRMSAKNMRFTQAKMQFQPPSALLVEQTDYKIQSTQSAVAFVSEMYTEFDATGMPKVNMSKSEIAKVLFPTFNWDEFDKIYTESEMEDKLSKTAKPPAQDGMM